MATEDPPLLCHVDAGVATPTTTLRSGISAIQRTNGSRHVRQVLHLPHLQHLQHLSEAT